MNRFIRIQHLFVAIIGVLIFLSFWTLIGQGEIDSDRMRQRAERLLLEGDAPGALDAANQLLALQPESASGLLIKGLASIQLRDCQSAEIALEKALKANPQLTDARQQLIKIYKSHGRFWELQPHGLELLRSGDSGSEFLIPLAAPDELRLSEVEIQFAAECMQSNPAYLAPRLGIARMLLQDGRLEEAIAILDGVISNSPMLFEAHCMLGQALFQNGDTPTLKNWHEALPATAQDHPEIWYLRGQQCLAQEQRPEALRCFCESLLRDPNHRRANFAMGNTLKSMKQSDLASEFIDRAKLLEEVSRLATRGDDQSGGTMNAATLHRIGALMQKLGRLHEAAAWYRQALRYEELERTLQALNDIHELLNDSTTLTLASANPALDLDRESYPLPSAQLFEFKGIQQSTSTRSDISFLNQAQEMGLKFQFRNGADPHDDIARMFEFSGGGVSVLDFDMDSWPDIYLTQGGEYPFDGSAESDQLFRNSNGKLFQNVTTKCGLDDMRYSQGAAIGDYNNDGFPDVYLGNIGENRLYLNHGDGTFSEVLNPVFADSSWTSGCALADVNNDSYPDIYCLNYLAGQDVLNRRCDRGGPPVQCPLHLFPGAQDRLYINAGDGGFVDSTKDSGIVLSEGKGLGVVSSVFHPNGPTSMFVANDDTPNFFFVPGAQANGVTFDNHAIKSGLAFGAQGTSQSCMGAAAGDVNHDGRLDLFVTNYANEPANLFLQAADGSFEDVANRFGLHQATLNPMGWGTQFIDADLDGWLDLVAVNGHLDANTALPLPYKMQAQCFHNQSGQRFAKVSVSQLGHYFEITHAGRAVARLDWNRDGADDLCISHVDEPVALLRNTTSVKGNYLDVHLRGTQVSRDAIGTIVKVTFGEEVRYAFLCAGDGFQASNEKKLLIGLGDWSSVDELVVFWPNGSHQSYSSVPINTEVMIIEGRAPVPLPSP